MTNIPSRRMAVLAYPDVQILDVVGPLQVFSHAGYPVEIIGVEAGTTPLKFVEATRLDAARRRLERTRDPVERIATDLGFGTAETMRRTFVRRLGVTPQDCRSHFRAGPVVDGVAGACEFIDVKEEDHVAPA